MNSSDIDKEILRSIPLPYGKYAINSLIEDYIYYSKLIGISPDAPSFMSSATLIDAEHKK